MKDVAAFQFVELRPLLNRPSRFEAGIAHGENVVSGHNRQKSIDYSHKSALSVRMTIIFNQNNHCYLDDSRPILAHPNFPIKERCQCLNGRSTAFAYQS
jgi:hypothetical protein